MKEYTGCNKCKYDSKESNEFPCVECSHNRVVDHFEPKTNADRIRNMSDEELARVIGEDPHCEKTECEDNCYECTLKWLQAEVKEGESDAEKV